MKDFLTTNPVILNILQGRNIKKMKSSFFPAYVLGLLIFIVASLPGSDLQKLQQSPDNPVLRFLISDPFMHFLIFGVLTFLICYGYRRSEDSTKSKVKEREKSVESTIPYLKVGMLGSGYGLFIEFYQGVLPWRAIGLDDLLWNTIGVILAISALRLFSNVLIKMA